MIYYILFISLFLTSLVDFTRINKSFKNKLFIFWIIIFILFKGLRWDTGTDFNQFYACFKYSDWNNIFSYWRYGPDTTKMEPGYMLLNVLIKTILPHYTFFLLITDTFILCSFGYLIKKYAPNQSLIALSIMIVSTEMFPVRQTLTTAILCYSIIFIQRKQLKYYLITIFICFTIHRSSLIMLPLYWICQYNLKFKYYLIIYTGLIFSRTILTNILSEMFNLSFLSIISAGLTDTYMVNSNEVSSFSISTIINSVLHLCLFEYAKRQYSTESANQYNIFINLFFLYLCINVIGSIPGLTMLYRISNNLVIVYPLCLTYLFAKLKKYHIFIPLFLYLGLWFIKLKANPCIDSNGPFYKTCYEPYYSIFDKNDNKEFIRTNNWRFPYK
jgi:hypothetical protein